MKFAVLICGLLGLVCLGPREAVAEQVLNGPHQGIDLRLSGIAPNSADIVLTADEILKASDTGFVQASIPPALLLFASGILSLGFLMRRRKR